MKAIYTIQNFAKRFAVLTIVLMAVGVGSVLGAGAITVSSSTIILPKGSTSVSTGDWISAAGVTKASSSWAYSDWTGDQTIGSYGSINFSKAGDLNNANLLQLQNNGGTISTTITSPAGVDIVIGCKRSGTKGTVTVKLSGASDNTSFASTEWSTISISTTSTTADFSVAKSGDNGLYISYISITPKVSCTTNATVTAGSNSSVTKNSARVTCASGISSLGSAGCSITSYGFVLNTTGTPTISDTKHQVGTSYTSTGTSFYKDLTGLSANTTYYVRPYATNGNGTAYGTQTTFTTLFEASITLDKNNSDASGSSSGSAKAIENATSLSNITAPTRTGYNLEGYYTTSGCATKIATNAGAFQPSITVSSNTWTNGSNQWKRNASETFYAKWTAKTYSITLNGNGATTAGSSSVTLTYNSASHAAITNPKKTDYIFNGWFSGSGGTGSMIIDASGVLQSGVTGYTDASGNWIKDATPTLYAKWTEHTYTNYRTVCCTKYDITLVDDGLPDDDSGVFAVTDESGNSITKACEGTSINIEALAADGYNFTEWVVTDEGDNDVTDDVLGAGNSVETEVDFDMPGYAITIEATFTEQVSGQHRVTITAPTNGTITVSWNDGSSQTITSGYADINEDTELTISTTPSTGYEQATLTVNGDAYNSAFELTEDVTVAATFSAIEYTISYTNMSGATNDDDNPETYTIEDDDITFKDPSKTGYTFVEWQDENEDEVEGIVSGSHGNVSVAAVWTANTYDVTLKPNGGSGSDQTVVATYDASMPLTVKTAETAIVVPTRTGYTFCGYYDTDAASGGKQYYTYSGTPTPSLNYACTWDKTSETNLYARWSPNSYTVTLDNNDATSGSQQTVSATYDASMPLTTTSEAAVAVLSRTGYTFTGWWDETSGGNQYYSYDGSSISSASNWDKSSATTLKAQWSINSYTLMWVLDGGKVTEAGTGAAVDATGSPSSSVEYNTAIIVPTVAKEGYTFSAWSSTPASNMPADNTTYTASWTINSYNIAVVANSHVTITATPASGDAIAEGSNADVNYNKTVTLNTSSLADGYTWGGWRVTKADDANTKVTVSGSGNGATFSLPAYAVKVEAIVFGEGIAWCNPEIDVTGDVYMTSYNGVSINSTSGAGNQITISSDDFGSATRLDVAYLDADDDDAEVDAAESVFLLCNDGSTNYDPIEGFDLDYEWTTTHSVRYTPNNYDKLDNYKIQFVLKHGDKILKKVTHAVHGRALPEEFVIASKYNGAWYALPDTMGGTLRDVYPIQIKVDNETTPTEATYAPNIAVYKGAARYRLANNVNSIRLTGSGSNWLETGATAQLKMSTTATPTDGVENKQVFYLKSDDFGAYELALSDKKLGIKNGIMGMFSSPDGSSADIYLLPITNKYTAIPATVYEWGAHGVVLSADMTLVEDATVNIGDADPSEASVTAVNSYSLSSGKYVKVDAGELTVGAVANAGKRLYIHWKDILGGERGVSQIEIPTVVAENANVSALATKKEVHVLPGVTLTGNETATISNLFIYPGATLNIATGTLTATTLRLRNGWTRAGEGEQYNVARVYIADDAALVKTTASIDLDIYNQSEGRHYYPFAVPFETPVSSIDYADSWLAGYSNYGMSGQYVIKYYDGASRAEYGGGTGTINWKVVDAEATLKPGVGYNITAIPVKGEAILRIPLTFDAAWTNDGEKGTAVISETTYRKDTAFVLAYEGKASEKSKSHAGWNMLGVPFMSCYRTSEAMETGAEIMTGRIQFGVGGLPMSWEESDVKYVSVPTHDFSEYIQTDITEAGSVLLPGWSFFVQIGKTGRLSFLVDSLKTNSSLPIYAPKRTAAEQRTVRAGIVLSDGDASDKTTFIVSQQHDSTYEIGADLEKLFGDGYTLAVYSITNNTQMAFNAMSPAEAAQLIPLGYRAPSDGEYTFSFNTRYIDQPLERVDLIDYQTGVITDLLLSDYTFTTSRTQENGRFALNIVMREETPTDVENVQGDVQGTKVIKFIKDDKLFILSGGVIYDATGKKVK